MRLERDAVIGLALSVISLICSALLGGYGLGTKERDAAIEQRDAALKQADELAAKLKALQPMGRVQSMPEALGEGW